jgi:UBX domain-containing protein 7
MEGNDLVAQFTEFTGSSAELAFQYLQLADFNIEHAMQLYFENGGAAIPEPPSEHQPTTSGGDESGVIHLDSDDEDVTVDETQSSAASRQPAASIFEDDAAMARRLQEELFAGGDNADGVRAPLARTTETLVGPEADGFDDDDVQSTILNQLRTRPSRSSQLSVSFPCPFSNAS